jgi:mannose-6-phosphate isomerase-like protein (cupin superfamily)
MGSQRPRPKVVALDASVKDYLSVLNGPPESVSMKSGYVVLSPGKSVGKHSTGHHEELLGVLEGAGEMLFKDGSKLPVKANSAVYCPPETEHDVMNSGSQVLRYVYVVAEVR